MAPGRPIVGTDTAPALRADEVHVWRGVLPFSESRRAASWLLLDDEERSRADAFRSDEHRAQFVAAHGMLRALLARYTGTDPAALRFRRDAAGKPALEAGGAGTTFNMAHTREVVVCAFARGREVGVDAEQIRDIEELELARRFFSAREVAALEALPADALREGFFTCWTRKEAYLKARGDGLQFPLRGFTVSLRRGEAAALLEVPEAPEEARRWRLESLLLAPGHVGAVAAEGHDWQLRCRDWPEP